MISRGFMRFSAKYLILLVCLFGMLLAYGCSNVSPVPPPVGSASLSKLKVSGNHIVTEDGQEIRLRGVNIEDPFVLENQDITGDGLSDPHFSDASTDLSRVKELGANLVRVAVYPGYYFLVGERYLTDYLDPMVDLTEKNGLYIIIDYHAIGRPGGWYPAEYDNTLPNFPTRVYYTDLNMAVSFWETVAARYGNRTHVLFDIYNEPADEKSDFKWGDWRPTGETLIAVILKHSTNLIVGPGPYWSSDLSEVPNNPYSHPNVVYGVHIYPGSLNPGDNQTAEWDSRFGSLSRQYPVIVSEWGFHNGGDSVTNGTRTGYAEPLSKYMDEKNLHWLAYIYHPFAEPPMLKSDWKTLAEFGEFVKERLQN